MARCSIRKIFFASRASGCTRQSRRSGRNLPNSDAAYHGAGRPNAATTMVCARTQRARAPCIWTQLAWRLCPDAAAAAYAFRTRSVVAIALWTQRVSSGRRVSRQMASGRSLLRHHESRCSCRGICLPDEECHGNCARDAACLPDAACQGRWHLDGACHGTTSPDAAVKAQRVRMQLPRHIPSGRGVSWQLHSGHSTCSGHRVSRKMASGRSLPQHHASRRSC